MTDDRIQVSINVNVKTSTDFLRQSKHWQNVGAAAPTKVAKPITETASRTGGRKTSRHLSVRLRVLEPSELRLRIDAESKCGFGKETEANVEDFLFADEESALPEGSPYG